jgi:glucosyl-3-phosphoglycerate synthase
LLECWAIGDNLNDLALLRMAERAFVIDPKAPALRQEPGFTVIENFDQMLARVPAPAAAARSDLVQAA